MGGRGGGVALRVADGVEGREAPGPQPRVLLLGLLLFEAPVPVDEEEGLHCRLEDEHSMGVLRLCQGVQAAAKSTPQVFQVQLLAQWLLGYRCSSCLGLVFCGGQGGGGAAGRARLLVSAAPPSIPWLLGTTCGGDGVMDIATCERKEKNLLKLYAEHKHTSTLHHSERNESISLHG